MVPIQADPQAVRTTYRFNASKTLLWAWMTSEWAPEPGAPVQDTAQDRGLSDG